MGSITTKLPIERQLDSLVEVLSEYRIRTAREHLMHADVHEILNRKGIEHIPEYMLGPRCRIDFWIPCMRIGIECKIDGGLPTVLEQLLRYCDCEQIEGLVLVTSKRVHVIEKSTLRTKPIRQLWVGGL